MEDLFSQKLHLKIKQVDSIILKLISSILLWSKTEINKPEWNGEDGEREAGTESHGFLIVFGWPFSFTAVTAGKHKQAE